jgi:putative FmdB family regulatory protein
MPVIFDWTCKECGAKEEYLTRNADTPPDKCKACGSETAEFKKHLVGPVWIEGDTPGSRPVTSRAKVNTVSDLRRDVSKIDKSIL